MTAVLDFGALPPEINSGRMYSGPGSTSMLTAAAAWQDLAAELRSQAASFTAVTTQLATEGWRGPAATSMAAAVAPYPVWMNTTAMQAEQAANQASTAAGAYEAARGMTVPPSVIAANRAQLASLVATNVLGQNTHAIATTEACYGEMWARDAAAMYGYAGASASATRMAPFTAPQPNTNPAALAAQTGGTSGGTVQTMLSQLTSAIPSKLQGLASPAAASSSASQPGISGILGLLTAGTSGNASLDSFWTEWGPNASIWNTIFSSGFYMPSNTLGAFSSLFTSGGVADVVGEAVTGGTSPLGGLLGPFGGLGGLGGVGSGASGAAAALGQAAPVGALSVPPTWTAAASPVPALGSVLGDTPLATAPSLTAGVPGIAATGAGARGGAGAVTSDTRFLIRPPMVPSWAVVG